jgi:GTP-binding protein
VLTKSDKISNAALIELVQTTTQLLLKHPAAHPYVHATSSEKRSGLDELRADIFQLINS